MKAPSSFGIVAAVLLVALACVNHVNAEEDPPFICATHCASKKADGICHPECMHEKCGFDGHDCDGLFPTRADFACIVRDAALRIDPNDPCLKRGSTIKCRIFHKDIDKLLTSGGSGGSGSSGSGEGGDYTAANTGYTNEGGDSTAANTGYTNDGDPDPDTFYTDGGGDNTDGPNTDGADFADFDGGAGGGGGGGDGPARRLLSTAQACGFLVRDGEIFFARRYNVCINWKRVQYAPMS